MQFFGIEDIKNLSKASPTTINWEAGSNLRIGGQAYNVTSVLTLDTATDIDTGSIANNSFYYIYAVVVAGTVSLKYSLSDSAPAGYSAYRRIGALSTDASSNVLDARRGKSFKKCQTRYLTVDVISTGTVTDLEFSNLDTTKNYSVTMNTSFVYAVGNQASLELASGGVSILRVKNRGADAVQDRNVDTGTNPFFKPSGTSMTAIFTELNNCTLEGNISYNETWVTLCELPDDGFDNTIETNEWTP